MGKFKKIDKLKCPVCGTEFAGANLTIAVLRGKCNQCGVDFCDLVARVNSLLLAVDALVDHWSGVDGPSFEYTNVQIGLIQAKLDFLRRRND